MFLRITSSDGDVALALTEHYPLDEDLEGYTVEGAEFINLHSDPMYWPVDTAVVLKVAA
jgi:hypothetical protein